MTIPTHWQQGVFMARRKRFLADVCTLDGVALTAHCPNTGKMRGVLTPQAKALYSESQALGRKYPHTLEALASASQNGAGETWVGINTQWPNRLIAQALRARLLEPFKDYTDVKPEVLIAPGTRIDFVLQGSGLPICYVEVKNVHYAEDGIALFPDTPTARGLKHLQTLTQLVQTQPNARAATLYVIQRDDCHAFSTVQSFDPGYAAASAHAHACGVVSYAYLCHICPAHIALGARIPCVMGNGDG